MANLDIGRYSKRFVQMFWDPEPKNDSIGDSSLWCLGIEYKIKGLGHAQQTEAPPTLAFPPPDVTSRPQARPTPATNNESYVKVGKPEDIPSINNGISPTAKETPSDDTSFMNRPNTSEGWPSDFLSDFESRLWLTYRSNFPPIPKSIDPAASSNISFSVRLKALSNTAGFTSDTGWGCMIRSGQSILANTLALLHFGRDWRRPQSQTDDNDTLSEKRLISLFADHPSAPFSIHNFVAHGASHCGTHPGQWFGPSATAKCIEALASSHIESNLRVYVTGDGPDIYESELLRIARRGGDTFLPTLLLVGTRLGIDRVTPVYRDALAAALKLPQAIGIAGGRPSSSHYFIGVQETQEGMSFFYLDPHTTRPALPYYEDAEKYTEDDVKTCHTRRLRRCGVEEMDPSMLIAFLFKDQEEWETWRAAVKQAPGKAIFHILEGERQGAGALGNVVSGERESALDEVETFDDTEDEEDNGNGSEHEEGSEDGDDTQA